MPLQFHIYISCCDETCTELAMTVALNRYGHTVAIINFFVNFVIKSNNEINGL